MLWTRKRICEEFDLSYLELVRLIEKLDLKAASTEKVKGLRYNDDEVERLRAHFATKERARRNAVSVSGVCRELAISKSAVEVLLATTQLVLDQRATETLGMRMVTRKSLDNLIRVRVERPTPPVSRPPGSIPIREAQERTGLSRLEVLKLRERAGQLQCFLSGPLAELPPTHFRRARYGVHFTVQGWDFPLIREEPRIRSLRSSRGGRSVRGVSRSTPSLIS